MPKNLETIDGVCFEGTKTIERIEVEDGSMYFTILNDALVSYDLHTLVYMPPYYSQDTYTINGQITKITIEAFSSTIIKEVIIPESVTTLGSHVFYISKVEKIVIPNSVTSIGQALFGYCSQLKDVTLSNKLKSLPDYTFIQCTSLRSITIPESVKSIGTYCFGSCKYLSVVLPSNITNLAGGSFASCVNLSLSFAPGSQFFQQASTKASSKLLQTL